MDVKLEKLIEKIKKEAVDEANKQAAAVVEKAEKEASSIRAKAEKDADEKVRDAEKKIDQFRKNSELALQQASRDALLLLREKITSLFDDVFKREVSASLTPDFMKTLIHEIVKSWAKDRDVEVEVEAKDLKKLEKLLAEGVKKEVKGGITLRPGEDVSGGFRIGLEGEDVSYDFTDESLAEMLMAFLNPKLTEILNRADG